MYTYFGVLNDFTCEKDQAIYIKFWIRIGIKCRTAFEMLAITSDTSTMSKVTVYEWYNRFKEGCEGIEYDDSPGRLSTSTTTRNVEQVKKNIVDNRLLSIFFWWFWHETCGSKVCFEIAEFRPKAKSVLCSGVVEWNQKRSITSQTRHNW